MTREEAYWLAGAHWAAAQTYFSNAEEASRRYEWPKVGELIWGFATQTAKMAAVVTGQPPGDSHTGTFHFLRELTKATGDDFFRRVIPDLNSLHENFYQPDLLDDQQVRERAAQAWELGARLWALAARTAG